MPLVNDAMFGRQILIKNGLGLKNAIFLMKNHESCRKIDPSDAKIDEKCYFLMKNTKNTQF